MKNALVVPVHKQSDNIHLIFDGIKNQTLVPDIVYLILDRPNDDEVSKVNELSSIYEFQSSVFSIENAPSGVLNRNGGELFLAPYVRNHGIELALSEGYDNIIFIDGDCIPQEGLVKSHVNKCSYNLPTLNVGRRREIQYKWKDQREIDRRLLNLELFPRDGRLIHNLEMLKQSLIVWSCNISMNKQAIELIKKFNSYYYGRNEVFSSMFNGTWGGEDGFLGIEAYFARVFINMLGETSSGVKHIDHPRPNDKYSDEHLRFLKGKITELGAMMLKRPVPLDMFN